MVSFQAESDGHTGYQAKEVGGGDVSHIRRGPSIPLLSKPNLSPILTVSLLSLFWLLIPCVDLSNAGEMRVLGQPGIRILFEAPDAPLAGELIHFYPEITGELRRTFGWELPREISIHLVREAGKFRQWAQSPLTVAVAIPDGNLIVMDASARRAHPFTLRNIFKHEVCHLLLHHHIRTDLIPRWLDEGIAQWVSDGAGDILMDQKRSVLNRVALRGRLIPIPALARAFPQDDQALILSYEESKDFLEYLISLSGPEGVLKVLDHMRQGDSAEEALRKVYGLSLTNLDDRWQRSLQKRITWWTFLSYHLYDILFLFAGLMGVYGFIRIMIKKRRRMKEEMATEEP